jgi:hypothetical protein
MRQDFLYLMKGEIMRHMAFCLPTDQLSVFVYQFFSAEYFFPSARPGLARCCCRFDAPFSDRLAKKK